MPIQLIKQVKANQLNQKFVNRIFQQVGKQVRYPKEFLVNVVTVNQAMIKKLNTIYRQQAAVTDVLSFAYALNYGDIILCYPQAVVQAQDKQVPVKQEVAWLIIHGILHLLGFDHQTAVTAKRMRSLEQNIIAYV
ncbi:MAG: rRNA maturation RNase YbeY [Patescibacteria group bacterium]|jgi:probable rRNA maturation factor